MNHGTTSKLRSFNLKFPWATDSSSKMDTRDRVIDAIRHCPSLCADKIDVRVQDGTVVLTGFVSSWENWSLATDAALSVNGVYDVINRLRIKNQAGENRFRIESQSS